jgi:hypothetical protein
MRVGRYMLSLHHGERRSLWFVIDDGTEDHVRSFEDRDEAIRWSIENTWGSKAGAELMEVGNR